MKHFILGVAFTLMVILIFHPMNPRLDTARGRNEKRQHEIIRKQIEIEQLEAQIEAE